MGINFVYYWQTYTALKWPHDHADFELNNQLERLKQSEP